MKRLILSAGIACLSVSAAFADEPLFFKGIGTANCAVLLDHMAGAEEDIIKQALTSFASGFWSAMNLPHLEDNNFLDLRAYSPNVISMLVTDYCKRNPGEVVIKGLMEEWTKYTKLQDSEDLTLGEHE